MKKVVLTESQYKKLKRHISEQSMMSVGNSPEEIYYTFKNWKSSQDEAIVKLSSLITKLGKHFKNSPVMDKVKKRVSSHFENEYNLSKDLQRSMEYALGKKIPMFEAELDECED